MLQIILFILFTACTTTTKEDKAVEIDPRIMTLVSQAESSIRNKDFSDANFKLQRALRINPKDPFVYLELSRLRFNERKYQESLGFINKGLRYTKGNLDLELDYWVLTELNYENLGNEKEAAKARAEVEKIIEQKNKLDEEQRS